MTEKNFEAYMYISDEKMLICIFSKIESKILYENEKKFYEKNTQIDENIINIFLKENIFKIEKQLNQFVNVINLIINCNQFQLVSLSIKQNIYGVVKKKNLINALNDLKNYVHNSYPNYSIIHYFVNQYMFDNKTQKSITYSHTCNHFCLETSFILLNKQDIFFYKKIFQKFQISVDKILSGKYVLENFTSNEFNECEMGLKILSGFNVNEVFLIQKSIEKKGLFERFFNIF